MHNPQGMMVCASLGPVILGFYCFCCILPPINVLSTYSLLEFDFFFGCQLVKFDSMLIFYFISLFNFYSIGLF